MRNRPKTLLVYSLSLILVAVSMPIQILFLYAHTVSELHLAFSKLTIMNFVVMSLLMATAWSAWHVHRSFSWLAPLTVISTIINNLFVAHYGEDYSPILVHTGSLLFSFFIMAPYLNATFREILAHPGKRWWRSESRQVFMQPVTLFVGGRLITETLSFDISTGGIFLQSPDYSYYGLNSGDPVSVRWITPYAEAVEMNAHVVRTTEAQGRYPRGIGIRFDEKVARETYV